MCGIVGFTGHYYDDEKLQRAVDSLHHRGPDGSGIYIAPYKSAGLGHARLSIIDLETGAQPLFAQNDELVLVCNGEIYDFERIKSELEALGHEFYTKSDSEVILHLYREYGTEFVHHLMGEFAFLLLDKRRRILIAVRDRFGIKPLFFHENEGKFVFASEAKAIFATGCHQPKIDVMAVRNFLSGVIPDSIFEEIQVVPPGCMMTVDLENRKHEIQQYWDLDLPPESEIEDDREIDHHAQTVHDAFDEAVRLRLRADVPVGVYLSGGIDSSIVAASAAKQHPGKIKAFTISFPGDENFDEYQLAKNMAKKIGAEFHSVTCDQETMLENTEECLWVSELPFHNFHGVGKFLLSRLTRQHVKVVLTGEGADEVFLGYVYFQPGKGAITCQMENRLKTLCAPKGPHICEIIKAVGFLPWQEHAELFSKGRQNFIKRLFHPGNQPQISNSHPLDLLKQRIERTQTDDLSLVRKIQYFCIKTVLTPYILTMLGDRQEMGHSIEGRTPFLDHHLFEKARRIPDRFKIQNGVEKYVLREAFKDEITEEIYKREKWPYCAPPLWIKKGIYPILDQLYDRYLSKAAVEKSGIFNYTTIRRCRWATRLIFFDCAMKRKLNQMCVFLLTIQILDQLYVQNFDENLKKRQVERKDPTRKKPPATQLPREINQSPKKDPVLQAKIH